MYWQKVTFPPSFEHFQLSCKESSRWRPFLHFLPLFFNQNQFPPPTIVLILYQLWINNIHSISCLFILTLMPVLKLLFESRGLRHAWHLSNRQGTLKRKAKYDWPPHWGSLFGKRVNNVSNIEIGWSKLVCSRRWVVLSFPLQWGFPATGFIRMSSSSGWAVFIFKLCPILQNFFSGRIYCFSISLN